MAHTVVLPETFTQVPLSEIELFAPDDRTHVPGHDHFHERLRELETEGLVKFARKPDGTPGFFVAPRSYFSDADWEIIEAILEIFDASGNYDAAKGEITDVTKRNVQLELVNDGGVTWARKKIQMIRTPTGNLSVIRPVAEKLLKEGVISGALDADLHAADAATVKAAVATAGVCDFCSAPGAIHTFDVPDFPMPNGAGMSVDGWAACDTCAGLVRAGKKQALLDRAVKGMAFPKFSRSAIADLHNRFWKGMDDLAGAAGIGAALGDYIEDRLPIKAAMPKRTGRDDRMDAVAKLTGLTRSELDQLLTGKVSRESVKKLIAFERQYQQETGGRAAGYVNPATIDRLLDGPKKPLADIVPHWQRALDAKFAALINLETYLKGTSRSEFFPESVDLNDPKAVAQITKQAAARAELRASGFDEDVKYLKASEAYSFNQETIAAIREAAQSVPHDAPLSSIETPNTGAGWFWFSQPLPISSSPIASESVNALLWGWTSGLRGVRNLTIDDDTMARLSAEDALRLAAIGSKHPKGFIATADIPEVGKILRSVGVTQAAFDHMTKEEVQEPALMFSAYVVDTRGQYFPKGHVAPSTRWYWPLSMSFHDMLIYNRLSWKQMYGPGAPHEKDAHVMGEEPTIHAVAELSLFFVMACLWFKQTVPILTREKGHVERHARKRMMREQKLKDPPTVQVVALRKSQRVPAETAPEDRQETARQYHCRWIVKGHPRLQACGPGRKDRKMIWIDAFTKGPDDKPLRTRERVYAVIR